MQREEIPEIPVEAIREAIVNSFAHRDYRNNKGNEVAIFKDRIEIYNPGDFPEGYTPEAFIRGEERSILRNKLIAQILYYSKDIESWGSGIKRIYNICKENGVEVEFKILKSGFVVVFYRPGYQEEKTTNEDFGEYNALIGALYGGLNGVFNSEQLRIFKLIKENPISTITEITVRLNMKRRTVERQMKELWEKGIIERIGSKKTGYWEVK